MSVTFVCSVHARSLWINTTVGHLYASPLLPGKEQDSHLGTNIQQTRPWTVCVSSASDVFVESLRHAGQSGDLKTALHETKSGSGSVLFLFLRLYSLGYCSFTWKKLRACLLRHLSSDCFCAKELTTPLSDFASPLLSVQKLWFVYPDPFCVRARQDSDCFGAKDRPQPAVFAAREQ